MRDASIFKSGIRNDLNFKIFPRKYLIVQLVEDEDSYLKYNRECRDENFPLKKKKKKKKLFFSGADKIPVFMQVDSGLK